MAVWTRIVALLLLATAAGAEGPAALPGGGVDLLPAGAPLAEMVRGAREVAAVEPVPTPELPVPDGVRVTIAERPPRAWDVQLNAPVQGPIAKGDVLLFSLWVRGRAAADEAGDARGSLYLQQNGPPHEKHVTVAVTGNERWRRIDHGFVAAEDHPVGSVNAILHLSGAAQTFELAGLRLINYGTTRRLDELPREVPTYEGRAPDAPWRAAAAARIAEHRTAPLTVRVVGADGAPVPGARVHVHMTRHAFRFGAAVTAQHLAADSPDARAYRAIVDRNYNRVVFENDLKWQPWEAGKTNDHRAFRREWLDAAFAWLAEHDIEVRGHYITWAPLSHLPKFDGPEALRTALWAHLADKVPDVGDKVVEWDAINHIVGWGDTLASTLDGDATYVGILRRARELAPPGVRLLINEGQVLPGGSRRDDYLKMVQYLIDQGAAPDGVGFMGHFSASSLTPPAEVYEVLDRFAAVLPHLAITELDVDVGAEERLQADYLRDVMTVAFSHPAMDEIIMWGFWEGKHWKPNAALYRRDWSLKPAGEAWHELVFGEWWTDVDGVAGADGAYTTLGFLGDYLIDVALPDGTRLSAPLVLGRGGASVVLAARPPAAP